MFSSLKSGFESLNGKRNSYKKEFITSVSVNTLKTMNSLRSLPSIKSKSLSTSSNHQKRTESQFGVNIARRKLGWLERRTWSFRAGNKRNVKRMECWPDITIIFSKDASEWDEYLTECFTQMSESHPLTIIHERIDRINFPLDNYETQIFSNSKTVLLILSPDLLDFIDQNADVFELTRLLSPKRTVVMLCGVQQQDISRFHRAALATYDQWTCLVAKDQDKEFVVSVIQTVLMLIQNESQSPNKPQFKLTPRKVREGNGKVFVLLDRPLSEKQQIDILFDGSNDNQVSIKWKNPYNLLFTIPDDMLRVARVMNISLICDNKNFMGSRPLKCETKMSELHSLLASVNSPFEFMCQTLGYPTLSQLDTELANRFDQKMPDFGCLSRNDMKVMPVMTDNKSSDCYLPTLLHFAAAYGLRELTSKLVHCPLALKACQTRNSDNLTPAQMAHHLNHSDIGALLEDFERLCDTQKLNISYDCRQIGKSEATDQRKANLKKNVTTFRYSDSKLSAHHQLYGLKLYSDLLHMKEGEDFSLKNENNNKSNDESIELNDLSEEYDRQEINDFKDLTIRQSISDSSDSESPIDIDPQMVDSNDKSLVKKVNNFEAQLTNDLTIKKKNSIDLNEIQKELIDIIEVFKVGLSFDKFELLFDNWQKKYCNVLDANESEELHQSLSQIKTLCEIGRKQQELENNKHSLNFNDLRYYLTSKLNNKLNDNDLKQTLGERLQLLSLNQLFCSDSLSSICSTSSSSSATNGSSIESSIERNRPNRQNNRNNYYKKLKTKVISLVDKQSQSRINGKQSDSTQNSIKKSRPPAPPPRPLIVDSINETNEANESIIGTTQDLNHSIYYSYQNDDKPKQKINESEEDVIKFDENLYLLQNSGKSLIELKTESKAYRQKMSSSTESLTHQYMNICPKRNESSVCVKRDPLIDYDLVPSGIPVPINSLRAKAILSTKMPKNLQEFEYDYDIPKVPRIGRINNKIKDQIKDKLISKQKPEHNLKTELQIFV